MKTHNQPHLLGKDETRRGLTSGSLQTQNSTRIIARFCDFLKSLPPEVIALLAVLACAALTRLTGGGR